MLSLRALAVLATASVVLACQPAAETPEPQPLFDASSAVTVDSALPISPIDAGPPVVQAPTSPRSGVSAGDSGSVSDAGAVGAIGPADAAPQSAIADASVSADAGAIHDAAALDGGTASDSSTTGDATKPVATTGTCGGATPHGCWPPKSGNPMGCPPQIHEQSEYYPPLDEWVSCESPFYERCIYMRPDGSEAYCACDLGVHWLCAY